MGPIFRHMLARLRGQILGWGIALFVLCLIVVSLYDVIAAQQDQFNQLLKNYPPEFSAFFGDLNAIGTPEGYLTAEFFSYMPLVLGVFALLTGSGLLASDEEQGSLDLILAHPVSRAGLFFGRLLAFVAATASILAVGWLSIVVMERGTSLGIGWDLAALPFLSLLAVLLFFGALALALSMLLPSRRSAAMVTGLTLVASFFITSLARIDEGLRTIARLSPLNYYQSGEAMRGLNGAWFGGLLAAAALLAALAWWRFERRDIRVSGEGSWRLPGRPRRPRDPAAGREPSIAPDKVRG